MSDSRRSEDKQAPLAVRNTIIQTLVTLTTIRWVVLAVTVGVLVGFPTSAFLLLLEEGVSAVSDLPYFYLLIPVGLLISYLLVSRLAPSAKGHGTEQVIDAIHHHEGEIEWRAIPVKMAATLSTLILGGSAGREGPSVQVGAGIASTFARTIRLNKLDTQRLVLCGVSAGFSTALGVPIAAAIFASEVLSIGRFSYNRLLPALISSFVSAFVARTLGVHHLGYSVEHAVSGEVSMLFEMVAFGIIIGLLGVIFISVLTRTERLFERSPIPGFLKALVGGLILILVVLATGTTHYIGIGMNSIDLALDGQASAGIAPFMKMLTTSVTFAAGGSGGVLIPVFFIGSTAGNVWAQIFELDLAIYSAIGMVSFLAATANTPLAGVFMAMELFGVTTGSWAAIAVAVAYLIVGHLSIIPSQTIHNKKTFFVDLEVHHIPAHFSKKGILHIFRSFFRGYRDQASPGVRPLGPSVAEHAEAPITDRLRPRRPRQDYYPLSTSPHEAGPVGPLRPEARESAQGQPEIDRQIESIREYVEGASRICVLTGAGLSAESGIPTYQDAQTGYWAQIDTASLATSETFRENPGRAWSWYAARRRALASVEPSESHFTIARIEDTVPLMTVVTQNLDDLHTRAGSSRVLGLHGDLLRVRCPNGCVGYHRDEDTPEARDVFSGDPAAESAARHAKSEHDFKDVRVPRCPVCGEYLRPDVVWYGEILPSPVVNEAFAQTERCDLFLVIGTSAVVQPATTLPLIALERGIPVIEINPNSTPLSDRVTLSIRHRAGDILPGVI